MQDQLAIPHRKKMIRGYEAAVRAGLAAGAYGVTLSGSGSTVIAITTRPRAHDIAAVLANTLTHEGNPATPMVPEVIESGLAIERR